MSAPAVAQAEPLARHVARLTDLKGRRDRQRPARDPPLGPSVRRRHAGVARFYSNRSFALFGAMGKMTRI
jgi:hypothetical protein